MKKLLLIGLLALIANSASAQATNFFFAARFDVNGVDNVSDTKDAIMTLIPPLMITVTNDVTNIVQQIVLDEFGDPVTNITTNVTFQIEEEEVPENAKQRARRWASRRVSRLLANLTERYRKEEATLNITGVEVETSDGE